MTPALPWRPLLEQASALALLTRVFERPRDGVGATLQRLAAEQGALWQCVSAASGVGEGQYLAIFGPGGPVSAREAAWRGRVDPGEILADTSAFYEAFAYRPQSEEPADHLVVEVGFVAYMYLKEAYALANEDVASAALTSGARERFLDAHTRRWLASFAARLDDLGISEYRAPAELLCARLGASAIEEDEIAPGSGAGDDPMVCGTSGCASCPAYEAEGSWPEAPAS